MIYIIHANIYKFNKLVDFLIPLFFTYLYFYTFALHFITHCAYLGFWALLYDIT
jgi:hypothetical protein